MWRKKAGRFLRVFTPFTILFIGLVILNFRIDDASFLLQPPVEEAATMPTQPSEKPGGTPIRPENHKKTVATAIANTVDPSPSPIAIEPTSNSNPTRLPREVATLAGPPSGSQFSLSSPLSFYWYPSQPAADDRTFALVIMGEDREEIVGMVSEPNLGTGYQINILPKNFGFSEGEYRWQVRLLQQEGEVLIGSSEQRPISLAKSPE